MTRSGRLSAETVKEWLTAAMVLDHHSIRYVRSGDEWRTKQCPTCGQRNRDSVAINATTGVWSDHAHGCRGDLFALLAGYAGLDISKDYPSVLELGAQIAGVEAGPLSPEVERKLEERRRSDARRAAEADAQHRADLAAMPRVWESLARQSVTGEAYLNGRGLSSAALRLLGDAVRFSPDGDPAVALRDLVTGDIVGIQYRMISGDSKLRAERGSQLAGSALFGRVSSLEPGGHDVAVIVEGLADTLAACLAFPGCAVFGAPGAAQMARVAAAVAPRIVTTRGWLLLTVDDDETGIERASDAIVAAVKAGLQLADGDAGLSGASTVRLVDLGAHHDLADAWQAGWRNEWPKQVAS